MTSIPIVVDTETGASMAGFGMFAALVSRYGVPTDLAELFPLEGADQP